MAKIRVTWDDSKVKALRVSIDGVRVPKPGTDKTVPGGPIALSWFALGNPGSAFSITIAGVEGTKVKPGPEFPCPDPPLSRKIPPERSKDFGACSYVVA